MPFYEVISVISSFAISLLMKRELVALPGYTHLLIEDEVTIGPPSISALF